jgi:beta-mannosidase
MACSWGWDWGPWLTTAGMRRPVWLHAWSIARFDTVRPEVYLSPDRTGRIVLRICVERAGPGADAETFAEVELHNTLGNRVVATTEAVNGEYRTIELDAGPINPWWPHSLGTPTLYDLSVRLVTADGIELDHWHRRIGFRTIELDTSGDELGARFTFSVNGMPFFARGVNWIPDDVFPSRLTPQRYRHRLAQAIEANVDMIRVWGGGIYED